MRGGAGTGKTTVALALAHAIAKANGGLVLYLTTEFSPVEITYKATLIGLGEEVVDVWPGATGMTPGSVVVEHLSVVRHGQPVASSAERKRSAIDAIWGLLHPEKESERRPPLPVRAVVIDALTLPEVGESEGALRADLVAFVQALENERISVVLVEELAPVASAWSSFVVDVVLELAFQPDPETHDLRRKLTVSKCRYALSIPGPHDYGLDSGVPGVWPDMFRIVTLLDESRGTPLFRARSPRLCMPCDSEGTWARLDASIVLSPYDQTSARAPLLLQRTPGAVALEINCGPKTVIGDSTRGHTVSEDDGVHAIGWAILSEAASGGTTFCFLQNLDGLLSRHGLTARVLRLLEALRSMGFLICIHSPSAAVRSLEAIADFAWGKGKRSLVVLGPRRHRALARRYVSVDWMAATTTQALSHLESAQDPAILETAHDALNDVGKPGKVTPTPLDSLRRATIQGLLGSKIDKKLLGGLLTKGSAGHSRAAWLAFHTGAEWQAARVAVAAVESEEPEPSMLLLWKAVCAAIARNSTAIDELKVLVSSPEEDLILDPLLRGLAATGQLEEADRIIADFCARRSLAPWMLDRLSADARLDSADPTVLADAASRLAALAANESLPLVHRAETFHNLGTAHDRLGERNAAIGAFEQALALNPYLDAARDELKRLRSPKTSSS